jgi:hypothetical protein
VEEQENMKLESWNDKSMQQVLHKLAHAPSLNHTLNIAQKCVSQGKFQISCNHSAMTEFMFKPTESSHPSKMKYLTVRNMPKKANYNRAHMGAT